MRIYPILICLLMVSNAAAQTLDTEQLDRFFDALGSHSQMMGSIAIAKGDHIVYKRSLGYAGTDGPQMLIANDTTAYHIGSVTKMFTATMIFQLMDEGKLSLATPLSDYFPRIPDANNITIALLLNHRSGLYDFVNDKRDRKWLKEPQTDDDILGMIARKKRHAAPGAQFAYSNSAYWLLAKIIERVTEQSYQANLQARICTPLGLLHTCASGDRVYREDAAIAYTLLNHSWVAVADMWFPNVAGVGDIQSTPADLVVFSNGLLAARLTSAASLAAMKTITDTLFGMGMMHIPFLEHPGYGHGGDTYGSHAFLSQFPADSLTVAICTNGESFSRYGIYADVLSVCFNEPYAWPDFGKAAPDVGNLAGYRGIYQADRSSQKAEIILRRKKLTVRLNHKSALALVGTGPNTFRGKHAGIFIQFRQQGNEMLLTRGTGTLRYKKVT